MTYEDIKKLDEAALLSNVKTTRKEIFELKMQKSTVGIEKSHELHGAKKKLAQLLTAYNAKKNN